MKHSSISLATIFLVTLLASCTSMQQNQTHTAVTSVSYSPDQKLLAYADAHEIRVLDADSFRYIQTLRGLPQDLEGADSQSYRHGVGDNMVFLDEDRIASSGMGGLLTIWDVHSGRRLTSVETLPGNEFASSIDYSPASNRLVIGTSAGRVLLTTLEDDHIGPLVSLTTLEGYIWDLQFSRDGRYVASASHIPGVHRARDSRDEPADAFAQGLDDPPAGEPARDFGQPVSNRTPGSSNVFIWDLENMEMTGVLAGATGVQKMCLVPGETALLTAGEDVEIWEFLTREQYGEVRDPSMVMQGIGLGAIVAASVVSLSAAGMGLIGPAELLASGFPWVPTSAFIRHACDRMTAISPDGQTIVTTTRGPTHNVMAVIDRKQNKVVEKWTADIAVCDLHFSMDGKHLVAASSKGLYSYDTTSWKKTKRP